MATIKELIEKHSKVPGDLRITKPYWAVEWLRPFFQDEKTDWHLLDQAGYAYTWPEATSGCDWQLYQEPRVKRAQYKGRISPVGRVGLPIHLSY